MTVLLRWMKLFRVFFNTVLPPLFEHHLYLSSYLFLSLLSCFLFLFLSTSFFFLPLILLSFSVQSFQVCLMFYLHGITDFYIFFLLFVIRCEAHSGSIGVSKDYDGRPWPVCGAREFYLLWLPWYMTLPLSLPPRRSSGPVTEKLMTWTACNLCSLNDGSILLVC